MKIDDLTSVESLTILTRKMIRRLGRVYCEIPSCDVMLGSIVLFTLTDFLQREKLVHSNSQRFPTVFTTFIVRGASNAISPSSSFSFVLSAILYPTLRQRKLSRGILTARFEHPFFGSK